MSSNTVAISVRGLGKKYTIAHDSTHSTSLREAIMQRLRHPFGNGQQEREAFWALRDVDFEIRQGEVVGIIGRNGAGKSTLLKLLTRITGPTIGTIDIHGRIASLLEVGTGFHPELTGRENVYLNGAILGMSRREISRKFDEIVTFSGVEKFLDTPVKRYSSGMYVRLAFAVAAHLDPDILIVDEVLAVGDVSFQKKCLGKMQGFAEGGGRTVLFVSHNMSAVNSLCNRALLLEHGRLAFDGSARAGVDRYMECSAPSSSVDLRDTSKARVGTGKHSRFVAIALSNAAGQPCDHFVMGETMVIDLEVECTRRLSRAEISFSLANALGTDLHVFVSTWEGLHCDLEVGRHCFRVTIPQLLVYPGNYSLTPWLRQGKSSVEDQVNFAVWFTVIGADLTGHKPDFQGYADGIYASKCEVYCPSSWQHYSPVETHSQPVSGGFHD